MTKVTRYTKYLIKDFIEKLGYKITKTVHISEGMYLDHKEIGMEAFIRGLCFRGFSPKMVIDIGAARGDWTRLALKYWSDSRYFLIEPLMEWQSKLKDLKKEYANLDYVLAAAGPEIGRGELGVTEDLCGSSFLYEGSFVREVPVITIDSLFEERKIEQPDLMKIDVQGFELFVLQGAIKAIEKCSLILLELQFIRFSPNMNLLHESIAWMVEHGFLPYEIVDALRRPLDGAMGQCDMLFCKMGHPLLEDKRWST